MGNNTSNNADGEREDDALPPPGDAPGDRKVKENGFIPVDSEDLVAKRKLGEIKEQNFDEIREICIRNNSLWEDPVFPAENYSIYRDGKPRFLVKWMRPPVSQSSFFLCPRKLHWFVKFCV